MLHQTFDLFDRPVAFVPLSEQLPRFPTTRYQGSKRKLVEPMAAAFGQLEFKSALDLFSGSGTVSLLLRHMGKKTDANDYLEFNRDVAELFLTATKSKIRLLEPASDLRRLLNDGDATFQSLVADRYEGIFFTHQENQQIDRFCHNLVGLDRFRQLVYIYAVGQALMKKRPYNLFHRANLGMRLKDVKRSFGNAATWEKSIEHHAVLAVEELMSFPFPEIENSGVAHSINALDLGGLPDQYDLIYADPPYLNGKGHETDYSNFYGFLSGLSNYKNFCLGDPGYPHKPMLIPKSGWEKETAAIQQVEAIARRWPNSIVFFSYRSDGLPTGTSLCDALSVGGRRVELHSFGEFKYALSKTDTNEELFIVSYP